MLTLLFEFYKAKFDKKSCLKDFVMDSFVQKIVDKKRENPKIILF